MAKGTFYRPGTRRHYPGWVHSVRVDGRRVETRLPEASAHWPLRQAQTWIKEHPPAAPAAPARPLPIPAAEPANGHSFAAAITRYAANVRRLDNLDDPRAYRIGLRQEISWLVLLRDELGRHPVTAITSDDLRDLANRHKRGCSDQTKNRHVLRPASAVLHYAKKELGWFAGHPFPDIVPFRETGEQRRRPVTPEEEALLLANASTPEQRLAILWWARVGTRVTETQQVRWATRAGAEGVYLPNREAWLVTKGGHLSRVDLAPDLVAALATLPHRPDGRVFGWGSRDNGRHNIRDWLTRLCDRVGIERVTPHMFRHAFVTEVANTPGLSLRDGMSMTLHKSVTQYLRYQHGNRAATRAASAAIAARRQQAAAAPQLVEDEAEADGEVA